MNGEFCTACGAELPEASTFCGACGTRVQAAAPADPAVAPPPPVTPAVATPAEAAMATRPPAAPPAAMPPAPPAMAPSPDAPLAYAPPPARAANPPWGKILSVLVGIGFLIFGGIKVYGAFFGAPSSSSEVRQMEDQIRHDLQARGLQVSQVQMTSQSRDRMTGFATVGNPAGTGSQYSCTATRQSETYFSYECAPPSGSSTSMPITPTPSSMPPMGAPTPSAGTGASPGSARVLPANDTSNDVITREWIAGVWSSSCGVTGARTMRFTPETSLSGSIRSPRGMGTYQLFGGTPLGISLTMGGRTAGGNIARMSPETMAITLPGSATEVFRWCGP